MPFALLCLTGCLAAIALWPGAVANLTSTRFLPHGYCYLWNPALLTLHVTSDAIIWLSYLSISATLGVIAHRNRRDLPFPWLFIAFGVFIVSCGFTHMMDIVVLWRPLYWLAGDIKLITALASAATAIGLLPMLPRIDALFNQVRACRTNERRFLAAAESAFDCFYIFDSVRNAAGEISDFRFAYTNANGARLISETPKTVIGKLFCVAFPHCETLGLLERCKQVVETGEPLEDEFPVDIAGIHASWLYIQVVRLEDGVAVTVINVSQRKETELALEQAYGFNQAILACSPFATMVTDLEGRITSFNPVAERLLLYPAAEVLGSPASKFFKGLSAPEDDAQLPDTAPTAEKTVEAECLFLRKDGSSFPAQISTSPLTGAGGMVIGTVYVFSDITERKRVQASIAHLAHHDALTGLPNRALLHDRLDHALNVAARERCGLALSMIDLDGFKQVNDTLGHGAGDALLVEVAGRFQSMLRHSDTLARMGGDEFVVLIEHLSKVQDAVVVADNLLNSLRRPFVIRNRHGVESNVCVGASIGICLYPEGSPDAAGLLMHADNAMYEAKGAGRNCYRIHGQALQSTQPG